jgi:N6-adenosine-specific RNA methylase IME4
LIGHPLANIFPLMEGAELAALAEDIRAHGLRELITLHPDGSILDGRNRYRACLEAGVEPQFETWDGSSALAFVLSLNLRRRHLDESQRMMIAAKVANMTVGGDRKSDHSPNSENVSVKEAGRLLNVGTSGIALARQVLEHGTPELIAAVEHGQIPVSQAASFAKASADAQQAIIEKIQQGVKPAEASRLVRADAIEQRRIAQPTGKYRVFYADPPWEYGNGMPIGTTMPRDHYPVMSTAAICALPIKEMAEPDAVLFLWVTSPILEESFRVINAWGFSYKASFVWDKVKHNLGHYNSVRHELLLVCARGSCQPDVRKQFDSVVSKSRTAHSVKPTIFREMIDTLYPKGTRIELFARGKKIGNWDVWGLEAQS